MTRLQGGNAEKSSEVAALVLVLNLGSPWSEKTGEMFPQVHIYIDDSCQNNSKRKMGFPILGQGAKKWKCFLSLNLHTHTHTVLDQVVS